MKKFINKQKKKVVCSAQELPVTGQKFPPYNEGYFSRYFKICVYLVYDF
jgi:hypothetical protein